MSGGGDDGYLVGVDVGGTTIKFALLDLGRRILDEGRRATPRREGPEAVVAAVLDAVDTVLVRGRHRFAREPEAVGVAVLGVVDESRGVASASAAVGWSDVPLQALLQPLTPAPVVVGHDVRAGALAEARHGAGRGFADFVFVTVGTGVGGAVVLDGRPHAGRGRAGEIGHVRVQDGGAPCGCGGHGCLETVAAAPAIVRRFQDATGRRLTVPQIVAEADRGEPCAVRVWRESVQALAAGLATASMLMDPQAIIIGGGVSLAGDALIQPLRRELGRLVRLGTAPILVAAELGDRAGVIGAAVLAAETCATATRAPR